MNAKTAVIVLIVALAALLGSQTFYTVNETEKAVLLQFGKLIEANIDPGLHIKTPFVNEVKKFDSRVITVDSRPERYFTREKFFFGEKAPHT